MIQVKEAHKVFCGKKPVVDNVSVNIQSRKDHFVYWTEWSWKVNTACRW